MMKAGMEERRGLGRLIARGVISSGGSNILLRGLEVLTALLILRWLSLYEYGIYQLALSTFELMAGFFFSGLASVMMADVSREVAGKGKESALFSAYAYSQVLLGILLWAVLFFGADLFSYLVAGNTALLKLASFLFLISPFENLLKLGLSVYLQFFLLGFYKISFVLIRLAVLVFLFFFIGNVSAAGVVVSTIAASVTSVILVLPLAHAMTLVRLLSPQTAVREVKKLIVGEGKWSIANDFLGNIGSSVRPFIIRTLVGVEAVAVFTVAHNLAGYLGSIFPLRDVLAPIFPREVHNPKILADALNRILKYSTLAFLSLAVAGVVAVPVLVLLFFPKYAPSLPLFYLYLVGMPFWGIRLAATPLFAALRAQRMLFIISAYRTALTFVLGVTLVSVFGLWGAALEASLGLTLILIPAYFRAMQNVLPDWRPVARELFWFDAADREVMGRILAKLRQRAFG